MGSLEDARSVGKLGLDVGFVCAGWPPDIGGVESHAEDLARRLMARGHRVHVLCLDGDPALEPFTSRTDVREGIDVRRVAYAYRDYDRLASIVVNRRADDALLAWMAETPCDVVHVHHLTGFGMGALRAIADVGVPLVMTLHDYWPLCPRGQMLRHDGAICARPETSACASCLRATFPHLVPSATGEQAGPSGEPLSDDESAAAARTAFALEMLELPWRLFTPSAAARDVYLAAGVDAGGPLVTGGQTRSSQVEVCENGVEVAALRDEVARIAAKRPPRDDVVRLGVLGTVLPSKGVLELARAFVAADVAGLTLEIHGSLPSYHGDTTYVEALRVLADTQARITVHGAYARDELAGILAGLDGVAAPSRWTEVFGLTVREARAAGLPVLVSDAGALPDVTANGAAGLVVPADDPEAWVEALRRFASDARAREAWGAAKTSPRSTDAMMLQLERAYVEAIVATTGSAPDLAHPLEGATAVGPLAAPATSERPGLLRRLLAALGF
jgi:glycosyltransferase involved in cell wall biosynthesis